MWDEYDYDEGSDIDNWEDEQVFQDEVLERMQEYDWEDEYEQGENDLEEYYYRN